MNHENLICLIEMIYNKICVFTDRECAFEDLDEEDEEMKHFFHDTWSEDFCPVATQLLQRMESYSSDLEPIESPSES